MTADKLEFHSFTGSSGGAGGITGSGKGAQQHQQAYSAPPRMAAAGAEGSGACKEINYVCVCVC